MTCQWDMEIVPKPGEKYDVLLTLGWEPFHFVVIPLTPQGVHVPGIVTANGSNLASSFVVLVGMRKQVETPSANKNQAASPSSEIPNKTIDRRGA